MYSPTAIGHLFNFKIEIKKVHQEFMPDVSSKDRKDQRQKKVRKNENEKTKKENKKKKEMKKGQRHERVKKVTTQDEQGR